MAQPKQSIVPPNLTPSLQILLQKQQEHAGLQALKEASGSLLARVDKLAESSAVMADGGEGEFALVPRSTPRTGYEGWIKEEEARSPGLTRSCRGGIEELAACVLDPEPFR